MRLHRAEWNEASRPPLALRPFAALRVTDTGVILRVTGTGVVLRAIRTFGGHLTMTTLLHVLKEFWREAYQSRVPGLPLALARVVMGLFWFTEAFVPGRLPGHSVLCILVGVSLGLGLLTKVGALLGVAMIGVHVVWFAIPTGAPLWPYGLLVLLHLLIVTTGCGRSFGLDQLIIEKVANWPGRRSRWIRKSLDFLI